MIVLCKKHYLLLLSLACFGSIIFSFGDSISHLHSLWLDNNNGYSHGYLVLAVSLYLIYQDRYSYLQLTPRPSVIYLILFIGCLACYLTADFLNIAAIKIPLLIPMLWFSLGSIGGHALARATAFPILFLFFATPIWDLLLPLLQSITVNVSRNALQFLGITAFYHNDTVTLPYGDVVIAESCSGLRYLTISLTLSFLYYYLNFRGHLMRGATMIGIAISLALISNWIRVTYIIYVAYTSKMQDPLVAEHYNFGWILYSISLLPFFIIARFLQPVEIQNEPEIKKTTPSVSNLQTASIITAIACITLIISAPHYGSHVKFSEAQQLVKAPVSIAPWKSQPVHLSKTQWQASFYGYDYEQHRLYSNTKFKSSVRLDLYAYLWQDQGKELISDTHFAAHRNAWRVTFLDPKIINGIKIHPQIVQDKNEQRLIWHWFNVAGFSTSNKRLAKIYELGNFALSEKRSSAVILISSPCQQDCTQANLTLSAAMTELNLLEI